MKDEIKNAKITGVTLSMADHGCLTYGLVLEFGACGCVYGGICIGHGYVGSDKFDADGRGLEAMMRIMNVVGVDRWEDLSGKYIRIVDPGWGGIISTIGNIIEDKWFNQREFFFDEKPEKE